MTCCRSEFDLSHENLGFELELTSLLRDHECELWGLKFRTVVIRPWRELVCACAVDFGEREGCSQLGFEAGQ